MARERRRHPPRSRPFREEHEIDLYERFSDSVSYGFYIATRADDCGTPALLAVAADAASDEEDLPDTFADEARLAINLILARTDD